MASGEQRKTFTVPATSGQYATETIITRQQQDKGTSLDEVSELSLLVESLPAGATVEVDLLKPGGNPDQDAGYVLAVQTHTTTGLKSVLQLALWKGLRVRVKSGGTAGAAVVSASWW